MKTSNDDKESDIVDSKLKAFIDTNCHRHGRAKVRELVRRLQDSLDPREVRRYPRWYVVEQLQSEFAIGVDCDGVHWVAGLSFEPARDWRVSEGGRLVLAR